MKEIGGFFELSLGERDAYHKEALALNSARNCLKYIIRSGNPKKIYVPAYCCDSLIEPLLDEGVAFDFYHLDSNLEMLHSLSLGDCERLIYINYFGLKSNYVSKLVVLFGNKLIVDNTQAFFEKPIKGIDTFYSPRKYFGVSDGGYLYTTKASPELLEQDESTHRLGHVLGRLERNASDNYAAYQESERQLSHQPIKKMSAITTELLRNTDYENAALIRQRNYWALHAQLRADLDLTLNDCPDCTPMVYPYIASNGKVRQKLIKNKIYTATYWLDAQNRVNAEERFYIDQVIYLPIDQRYTLSDMRRIVEVINE